MIKKEPMATLKTLFKIIILFTILFTFAIATAKSNEEKLNSIIDQINIISNDLKTLEKSSL